jgi:hypothetical protein
MKNDLRFEATVCRCLEAYDSARKAKAEAEEFLEDFRTDLIEVVVKAIERYNQEEHGSFTHVEHKTDAQVVHTGDRHMVEVTVTLGYFRERRDGSTLTPREAWAYTEDQLVGELRAYLTKAIGLESYCRVRVHPPDDYDMYSADPDS